MRLTQIPEIIWNYFLFYVIYETRKKTTNNYINLLLFASHGFYFAPGEANRLADLDPLRFFSEV